jgi:hypothetical protein
MYIYDTAALLYALTLPLEADLRQLLRQRADHLATLDRAVADATYHLIVDASVTLAELEAELGWSPLLDLDGAKFGDDAFHPFHDFCADRGGWFELMFAVSNEAVVVLLVQDDEGIDADLLSYCRTCVTERL